MSESLLFAILGFLVACLLGTVFASFLWRRAVTVTTRKIAEDENFAGLDEVADLKADLRAAQSTIGSKDREIGEAAAKAKASGEGAAENLKQELQNADAALDTAHGERDAAKAALASKEEEIKAAEGRTEAAQERVAELENAIRTLVKETSLFETSTPKQPPLEAKKLEAKPLTSPAMSPNADGDTEDNTKPVATEATSKADEEDTPEPSLAISRSLEERIEALKQGESTSA